jgi:hypothetical protein
MVLDDDWRQGYKSRTEPLLSRGFVADCRLSPLPSDLSL